MPPPTPNREVQATVLALAAVLCWSTVATAFKLGLAILTPLQLLLQAALASSGLFLLILLWRSLRAPAASLRPTRSAFVLGLLNPLLYYPVLFGAYERLPAQLAQSVNYTWAVTLALLAVPLLGQRLHRRRLLGIGVSYAGVAVIVLGVDASGNLPWDWPGLALAFASTFIWALYWLQSTRTAGDPVMTLTWSFLIATPGIAVLCFLVDGWPVWNLSTLAFGLWVGLAEMGVAFLLWQSALRHSAQAARLGQLVFLSPFLSLVFIEQILQEPVPATSWAGLGIIVAGLLLARPADGSG